jgi:hypothetical protein
MVCEVRPQYETGLISWITMLCICVAATVTISRVTVGILEKVYAK